MKRKAHDEAEWEKPKPRMRHESPREKENIHLARDFNEMNFALGAPDEAETLFPHSALKHADEEFEESELPLDAKMLRHHQWQDGKLG